MKEIKNKEQSQAFIDTLIRTVERGDGEKFLTYLLYKDPKEGWRPLQIENLQEREWGESRFRRILGFLNQSDYYVFDNYFTEEEEGYHLYVWKVLFKKDGVTEKLRYFKVTELDGKLYLADIDW